MANKASTNRVPTRLIRRGVLAALVSIPDEKPQTLRAIHAFVKGYTQFTGYTPTLSAVRRMLATLADAGVVAVTCSVEVRGSQYTIA